MTDLTPSVKLRHAAAILDRPDATEYELDLARRYVMEVGMDWQPIETCPETGLFLAHEGGMMRTMWRYEGKWELPDIPILIDKAGNRLVSREIEELRGERLEIAGGIREPTEWTPLPSPPDKET